MFGLALTTKTADANWLLGTIAQVSGTLVAIIGGFLVSRVLGSVSEQRAFRFRVADLEARASVLRAELEQVEADLLKNDWLPWFEKIAPGLASVRGHVTIDEALDEVPCEGRGAAELRDLFEQAKEEIATAVSELETLFTPGEPPPPDLEEIVDLKAMSDLRRIAHWGAYIWLTNEFAKAERDRRSMFMTIPFSAPDPPPRDVQTDSRNVRRAKEDGASALRTELRLVGEEARQASVAADAIDPSFGSRVPAALLTYLALAGVVLPLALMARRRETVTAFAAWTVFGALTLGLAGMLWAIWWSVRTPGAQRRSTRVAAEAGLHDGSTGRARR